MTHTTISGVTYIVCQNCKTPVGKQRGSPGDYAAYDHPGEMVTVGGQATLILPWKCPLCAPCYLAAFAKRYPGALAPTTLEDRRLIDGKISG